jgi:ribonucleotide monophosphatase NagD (HAD superfamily)
VVGDDLRADVALAARQGWDSLLVLTGAGTPGEVGGDLRPTFIEPDLSTALARPRWRRGGEEERAP